MRNKYYKIRFKDTKEPAGFADILYGVLCKGGTGWEEAIFETKKVATEAILFTNAHRRHRGWKLWKFEIVLVYLAGEPE